MIDGVINFQNIPQTGGNVLPIIISISPYNLFVPIENNRNVLTEYYITLSNKIEM
jgi:hypothetical protein